MVTFGLLFISTSGHTDDFSPLVFAFKSFLLWNAPQKNCRTLVRAGIRGTEILG